MINAPTTATSAKFRNLIPATIDIYYEDGGDGVFQGTLDLGKEYTINTYEGHVFYFTEKGRKELEVARFVIDKDVVSRLAVSSLLVLIIVIRSCTQFKILRAPPQLRCCSTARTS